jgi:hypothetical protein
LKFQCHSEVFIIKQREKTKQRERAETMIEHKAAITLLEKIGEWMAWFEGERRRIQQHRFQTFR